MNGGESLRTSVTVEDTTVVATLAGTAESDARGQLSSFIEEVQRQAAHAAATHVVADIRALEFATAAFLDVLSVWVTSAAESARYTIEFLSSPDHAWQRRSLDALIACAPEIVRVRAP